MPGETIRLVDSQGVIRDVPVEAAASALDAGWTVPTHGQELGRVAEQAREEEYGGAAGAAKATLAGAGRGLTLGLTDVAARAIGGEDTAIALEGYRDENPGLSIGGEIAGAIAPIVLSGGTYAPAALASAAGRGAARAAGAGLRGAIIGGATEGAIFGAGAAASELALSRDPLTAERAASVIGSNVLFGGATGGALAGAGNLVERGLVRAKSAIDNAVERSAAGRRTPVDTLDAIKSVEDADLTALDAKQLKVLREREVEAFKTAQAPEREKFVAHLQAEHRSLEKDKDWLAIVADRNDDKYTREAAKVLFNQDKKLRALLDNRVGLIQQPGDALRVLQTQRQALETLVESGKREMDNFYAAYDDAERAVREELLGNKIPGYVVGKGGISPTSPAIDDYVAKIVKERYPRTDSGAPIIPRDLIGFSGPELEHKLNFNAKLQESIGQLIAEPASAALSKIDDALAIRGQPQAPSLGGALMSAAAPFTGPLGAAAAAGGRIFGNLKQVMRAAGERTGKAASAFIETTAPAVKYVPVLASKTLSAYRYGRSDDEQPADLPGIYKRRTEEVKRLTEYDETGTPRLRFSVRRQVAEMLKPMAMVDPIAADRLETNIARRIEYLSGKIPRRPDFGTPQIGPDTWQPSDMEMRSWARTVAAVEDPHGVEERAIHGALTPEDVEAYWAVYPERAQDFKQQVMLGLSNGKVAALPYERKQALWMLVGQPVDPSQHPKVVARLQGQFPNEPGSSGGAQPPRAQPQFGSIKKTPANNRTPAQERAQ